MSKILMLKGLPASGKSTYAKELVARGGWKRINKDDLRSMLDNSKFTRYNEKYVVNARDVLIRLALGTGASVVVDDTNFAPYHEETLSKIADEFKIPFEVKFFDVDVEECLERNIRRPHPVREKVIWQMYDQYLKPAPEAPPIINSNLPWAIICDIDGTLANMDARVAKYGKAGAYQWDAVGMDSLVREVAFVLERMQHNCADVMEEDPMRAPRVILLSGRDGICRPETEKWLADNNIKYDYLFMREAGNSEKDSIIKRRIYENEIAGNFNIEFVLDDRNQVVDMWRSLGLKCFQVAPGNF